MKMGKITSMLTNATIHTEFRWDNNVINHVVEKIIMCGKTFHATVTAQKARHITWKIPSIIINCAQPSAQVQHST